MSHQNISFIKSAIRIVGYGCLVLSMPLAALVLIVSELVGILEEIGQE